MSPEVRSDIEKLIAYSVKFAENLLLDSGEYYPFGSIIGLSGGLTPVSILYEEEYPESQKIIDGLTSSFEEAFSKKEIRAYCVAYDVSVKNEKYNTATDAILLTVKHRDVLSRLSYYYPYKLSSERKLVLLEPWGEHEN